MKKQPTECEKIFVNYVSDYINFQNTKETPMIASKKKNKNKTNSPIKKWEKYLSEQSFFQRGCPNGQQLHEKVLKITNH